MTRRMLAVLILAAATAVACGGGEKTAKEPTGGGGGEVEEGGGGEEGLVPEERYDELRRLFDRKTTVIGRCFVEAMDAGEVKKDEKIIVTVTTTVMPGGKAKGTKIEKATTPSKTFRECVVRHVESWDYPEVPEEIQFSHVYRFEEF